jgi:hypothetical protein
MEKMVWLILALLRFDLQNQATLAMYQEIIVVLFFGLCFSFWFCQVLLNPELNHSADKV